MTVGSCSPPFSRKWAFLLFPIFRRERPLCVVIKNCFRGNKKKYICRGAEVKDWATGHVLGRKCVLEERSTTARYIRPQDPAQTLSRSPFSHLSKGERSFPLWSSKDSITFEFNAQTPNRGWRDGSAVYTRIHRFDSQLPHGGSQHLFQRI